MKTLYQRATLAELLLRKLPGIEDDHGRDGRRHRHSDRGTPTRSGPAGGNRILVCAVCAVNSMGVPGSTIRATSLFARSLITTTLPGETATKMDSASGFRASGFGVDRVSARQRGDGH